MKTKKICTVRPWHPVKDGKCTVHGWHVVHGLRLISDEKMNRITEAVKRGYSRSQIARYAGVCERTAGRLSQTV